MAELNKLYRKAAASMPGHVFYVAITDVLCPGDGHCPAALNGRLARYDSVHYTATFSRVIAPIIIARARRAGVSFQHRRPESERGRRPRSG